MKLSDPRTKGSWTSRLWRAVGISLLIGSPFLLAFIFGSGEEIRELREGWISVVVVFGILVYFIYRVEGK